jgi:hypothetical protein
MTQAVLDGAAAAGAKLVFADNLYVYGPPDGPMTEETPQRAEGKKGRTRIKMADAVLGAHADGKLRVTIGRSSDYYGARGTASTVGENIMKPALRGKRARWLGSGRTDLCDIALAGAAKWSHGESQGDSPSSGHARRPDPPARHDRSQAETADGDPDARADRGVAPVEAAGLGDGSRPASRRG